MARLTVERLEPSGATLRFAPTRIIVGEVRGDPALAVVFQ
jgi:Flp pilus assembly CpaF family ATPase